MAQYEESSLPAGVPPGVAAAWGLGSLPSKGPKRGLSTDRIVRTAIEYAQRQGVESLSMSRVASALGVSTMALYRYVEAKSDLLVLMTDAALGRPPESVGTQRGWRAALESWAWAQWEVYRRHEWMLYVTVSSPPATPHSVAWMERGLYCLRGTGLDVQAKLGVLSMISSFIRGEARLAADLERSARTAGTTVTAATSGYGVLLSRLTNPADHPEIAELLGGEAFEEPGEPGEDFALGLGIVLDGVEVLVDRKGARDGCA